MLSNLKSIILVAVVGSLLLTLAACSAFVTDEQICMSRDDSCRKPPTEQTVEELPPLPEPGEPVRAAKP